MQFFENEYFDQVYSIMLASFSINALFLCEEIGYSNLFSTNCIKHCIQEKRSRDYYGLFYVIQISNNKVLHFIFWSQALCYVLQSQEFFNAVASHSRFYSFIRMLEKQNGDKEILRV